LVHEPICSVASADQSTDGRRNIEVFLTPEMAEDPKVRDELLRSLGVSPEDLSQISASLAANMDLVRPAISPAPLARELAMRKKSSGDRGRPPLMTTAEKQESLLRQMGKSAEEYENLKLQEMNDPRVREARESRFRAESVLRARERNLGSDELRSERLQIARTFNEAVSHTVTMARMCEHCGKNVVYRHKRSVHCSDKCGQGARNAVKHLARKMKPPRSPGTLPGR